MVSRRVRQQLGFSDFWERTEEVSREWGGNSITGLLQTPKTGGICVPHCVPSSLSVGPRKTVGTANKSASVGSGFPYALSQLQILVIPIRIYSYMNHRERRSCPVGTEKNPLKTTKDIKIRGVEIEVVDRIEKLAGKKGTSREEYLRQHLRTMAVLGEVREMEERYVRLVEFVCKSIQDTNVVLEKILTKLEDT